MSSGEQTEDLPALSQIEDFSPPGAELGQSMSQSRGEVKNPGAAVNVLDLIIRFELMGTDGQTYIDNLKEELAGQPERLLAGILVERSYLTEEELDSVVLARYLLACGKITMPQLELVMDEIKVTKAPLWVVLVAKGWLKMSDVV